MKSNDVIPKVINYCWFGGSELGVNEIKCMNSWKQYLPDYQIVRWDESNFDVRCCAYVKEAYEAKKWAFVSDYARFKILYEHGGLYFDTDVEIIKPIDDIIENGPFMGFQTDPDGSGGIGEVAPGLGLGAVPGMPLYLDMLEMYEHDHFILSDGSLNVATVVQRMTDVLHAHGLKSVSGIQHIAEVTIYPAKVFNPKDFWTGILTVTKDTRSIHHFDMSWVRQSIRTQQRYIENLTRHRIAYGLAKKNAAIAAIIRHRDFRRVVNHMRGFEERE